MRGLLVDTMKGEKCFPWRCTACLFSGSGAELTKLIDEALEKIRNKEICPDCGGEVATGELEYDKENADESVGIGGCYFSEFCEICGKEVEED